MYPFLSTLESSLATEADHKYESDFSSYLLKIGNGEADVYPEIGQDMIQIPQEYYLIQKMS